MKKEQNPFPPLSDEWAWAEIIENCRIKKKDVEAVCYYILESRNAELRKAAILTVFEVFESDIHYANATTLKMLIISPPDRETKIMAANILMRIPTNDARIIAERKAFVINYLEDAPLEINLNHEEMSLLTENNLLILARCQHLSDEERMAITNHFLTRFPASPNIDEAKRIISKLRN